MPEVDLRTWLAVQTWPDLRGRLDRSHGLVAYEHPYGFVVCRLTDSPVDGWQIRVHLWPARREMEDTMRGNGTDGQQVHAHGWGIASHVVLGAIEESTYRLETAPSSGSSLYRVTSDYGSGTSRLEVDQPGVRCQLVEQRVRTVADPVTEIPRGTYHSSVTALGPTVTVVATEMTGGASFVVAPSQKGSTVLNARRSVSDLGDLLAAFDRLHETRPGDDWAAFAFLVTASRDVLLVRSTRRPEQWQPVGGRQEIGDLTPVQTVLRETDEEVGLHFSSAGVRPLTSLPRDVGSGPVHFFVAFVDERPILRPQASEVFDHRWVPLDDLDHYAMYPASAAAVPLLRQAVLGTSAGT